MDSRTSEGAGPPGPTCGRLCPLSGHGQPNVGRAAPRPWGRAGGQSSRVRTSSSSPRAISWPCAQRSSAPTTAPQSRWRKRDRAAVVGLPPIGPLHERDDRRQQVLTLLGDPVPVAGALAGLAVGLALEQPGLDELAQPRGGHRLARADARDEVVEAGRPVEGLAHEQERRPRAEDVERRRERAPARLPPAAGIERTNQLNRVGHAHSIPDFANPKSAGYGLAMAS